MDAVDSKAQEYGVKAFEVVEHDTPEYLAFNAVKGERNPRGAINCPLRHKLHSDLNPALNVLKKANAAVSTVRKPPSFLVDLNTIAPVKGCNPRDLGNPRPSWREGGRLILSLILTISRLRGRSPL
ncbi:MAG: hypothetical protein RXR41_00860 [Candidatus Marsarchaeota archaeon]